MIKKWEWAVAVALSIVAIALHALRMSHAGALWRDESGALQLAMMPTAGDILQNFSMRAFQYSFRLGFVPIPPSWVLATLTFGYWGCSSGWELWVPSG